LCERALENLIEPEKDRRIYGDSAYTGEKFKYAYRKKYKTESMKEGTGIIL